MTGRSRAIGALFALATAAAAFGAPTPGEAGGDGAPVAAPPPGEVRVRIVAPDAARSGPREVATDVDAPAPAILVLRGAPLPVATRFEPASPRALALARLSLDRERERLAARLRARGLAGAGPVFRRDYHRAIDGVALDLPPARWAEVAAMPEVRSLHPDVVVRSALEESVPLVGAPAVWSGVGATGAGVVVALLDTGVDATLPDLGGGIGAGRKIAGGHDFVNDDAEPDDDNGHGTHVAGIVAASGSGSARGVAPDATLLAYKVLDARGG